MSSYTRIKSLDECTTRDILITSRVLGTVSTATFPMSNYHREVLPNVLDAVTKHGGTYSLHEVREDHE